MRKIQKTLIILLALMSFSLYGQTIGQTQGEPYDQEALFSLALNNSGELGILSSRAEQARQETAQTRAARLPTLSASASYSFLGLPPKGVTLEAGELGAIGPLLLPAEETVFLEDTGNHYFKTGLVLTQSLYTWGKLNGAIEAARGAERMGDAALTGGERKLETEIKTLLTTLSLLRDMDTDLQSQEDIVPSLVKIVEESVNQGFLLKKDLLEVKILTQQVITARLQLNHRQQIVLNRLSHLTGLANMSRVPLDLTVPLQPYEIILPTEKNLLQGLIQNNSDLDQLNIAREIQESLTRISQSEKSPLPDMGFRLELGFADDVLPFSQEEWTTGLTATATLSLQSSLFDGGRDTSAWKAEQAREEESRLTYEETLLTLLNRVKEDRQELELIRAEILHEELKTEMINEEIKVKRNLWQSGAEGEEELLKKELEALGSSLLIRGKIIDFYGILYGLEYMTGKE